MTQAHDPRDADEPRAHPRCPYCGAAAAEPLALFGKQLLTVQLYCQQCNTPFEFVKDDAILQAFEAREAREARKDNQS